MNVVTIHVQMINPATRAHLMPVGGEGTFREMKGQLDSGFLEQRGR